VDDDSVRRVPADENDDVDEAWQRLTDEPSVRGVEVLRDSERSPEWSVTVWAMEFVREGPLESELRRSVASALQSVAGVVGVVEEDREVWIVAGSPNGEALTRAVADAVDRLAPQIRTHIETLGGE
jgi:hypothetical protein